ncbi:hypothetical protein HMI54_000410 [Coelomomyces lativittatus]|nr:hypothetical protein HMI54_000410 [Coelomomyces lativittatus]KAJ1512255.1 hypothetical protein HMI56_004300 [Coelomomyces lativittatus]KAJ1514315.1 hypothetical protein HMI55_004768 [Coelomomyces lativittatus]
MKYLTVYCSFLIALCILLTADTLPLESEFDSDILKSDNKKIAKRMFPAIMAVIGLLHISLAAVGVGVHYASEPDPKLTPKKI